MLYLFCGVLRKADVKQCLKKLASKHHFELEIREVDMERSSDDDLTRSQLWDELLEQIRSGHYDVVFMSPPVAEVSWSKASEKSGLAKQKDVVEFANYKSSMLRSGSISDEVSGGAPRRLGRCWP